MKTPSVGCNVQYHSQGPGTSVLARAAIITSITDAGAKFGLVVFDKKDGVKFIDDVPYSDDPKPGHWSCIPE